jgi:hypothetical protein
MKFIQTGGNRIVVSSKYLLEKSNDYLLDWTIYQDRAAVPNYAMMYVVLH